MTAYRALIEQIAEPYLLDANLVESVVIAESNGMTDAFRHEPDFWERYLKGKPEWASWNPRRASSSYGLCQVMYPTAKEYGFGDLPELLFIPDVGLKYGCLHLSKLLVWADGDVRRALAAYNGGKGNAAGTAPQRYAARVLKLYESVKAVHPARSGT
jgi:soluble lytic murein transglycosylase-like protein